MIKGPCFATANTEVMHVQSAVIDSMTCLILWCTTSQVWFQRVGAGSIYCSNATRSFYKQCADTYSEGAGYFLSMRGVDRHGKSKKKVCFDKCSLAVRTGPHSYEFLTSDTQGLLYNVIFFAGRKVHRESDDEVACLPN